MVFIESKIRLPENRIKVFTIFFVFLFFVLLLRLFYLQIISGKKLLSVSEENRVQLVFDPASRGVIFDSNKVVLAANRASYSVYFSPTNLSNDEIEKFLCEKFKVTKVDDLTKKQASYTIQEFEKATDERVNEILGLKDNTLVGESAGEEGNDESLSEQDMKEIGGAIDAAEKELDRLPKKVIDTAAGLNF